MTTATINLTAKQQELLLELATMSGRNVTDVLTDVVARSLADVQTQRERLEQALHSRAEGRSVSHEQALTYLAGKGVITREGLAQAEADLDDTWK